jgi:hypothetical protein
MRGFEETVVPDGAKRRDGDPEPLRLGPPSRAFGPPGGTIGAQHLLVALAIIAAAALILLWMGRLPICKCGYVKLWHGVAQSAENSQHLTDWYTPSHIVHGFLFYGGLWLLSRSTRWNMSVGLRLVLGTMIEAGWEIAENTDFVINRYRETTIALDYYGDSVVNSGADMLAMALGFILAWRLPVVATVLIAAILEIGVGYWIRDNLTLNVIMLLYPLDVIKTWQSAA